MATRCVFQELDKALKKALRSDLEDVSLALLMSPAHFDAYLLRKATKVNISSLCRKYQIALHVTLHFTGLSCQQGFPL